MRCTAVDKRQLSLKSGIVDEKMAWVCLIMLLSIAQLFGQIYIYIYIYIPEICGHLKKMDKNEV